MVTLAAAGLLAACGGPDPLSALEKPAFEQSLEPYALPLQLASISAAQLGWQLPPEDCAHAYRISVAYEPAMRFEDDNESHLALGRHPRQEPDAPLTNGPIAADTLAPAQLYYHGLRAERIGASRDIYFTRELVGPSSPTAACMPRTWDPMEDALALGWPRLTGRLTAVGEKWAGLRVGGKCNRSACVDPKTGGGGEETHDMTCVTAPWEQRLGALFEHEGEHYAWIRGTWTDGHGPGEGIVSDSRVLMSVDHGRPVWAQVVVDHKFGQPAKGGGFTPVVRRWTMESIDTCPGSLAAAGWDRPALLDEKVDELRERLANADELRRSPGETSPSHRSWEHTE